MQCFLAAATLTESFVDACEDSTIEDKELANAERDFDFFAPSDFRESLFKLRQILGSVSFQQANPGFAALTASDMTAAWKAGLPRDLVAFCLQPHSKHTDYYCFDRTVDKTNRSIMVFADDAIVYDWPDFNAFLKWLESQ